MAKQGYKFAGWDDGEESAKRRDENVTEDKVYTAKFVSVAYTVNYFAIDGGCIEGESEQTVNYGENAKAVTAVADENYTFVIWSDGVTNAERTDEYVCENISVYPIFKKVKWSVTYTCDNAYAFDEVTYSADFDDMIGITAEAKVGYKFVEWSDGLTTATRIDRYNGQDIEVEAIFEKYALGLPIFSIDTENGAAIVSKEDYINCTVSVSDTDEKYCFDDAAAKIRGRGNTTWGQPKNPYKLKFDSKINLFGNGKAKTWTLIANYFDYSLIRNYLAYSIGGQLDSIKDTTTTVQFVDVYLNDDYVGVYLVCEQVQTGTNRVDISESFDSVDTGYLIELDGRAPDEGVNGVDYFYVAGQPYAIKTPDVEDDKYNDNYLNFIKTYLEDCQTALRANDYSSVLNYIDVNTFAETYIVHELFNCVDVINKSFYLYKDAGGKLCSGPIWDFDVSAGNCNYLGEIINSPEFLWATNNIWYSLLLEYDEFKELVAQKLATYSEAIKTTIDNSIKYVYSLSDAFERNFERWQTLGTYVWPNTAEMVAIKTWRGQVEYVRDWLTKSLEYMQSVYTVTQTDS